MTKREFQEYKECTFDAFAKAVIRNAGTSIYRKESFEARKQTKLYSQFNYPGFSQLSNNNEDLVSQQSLIIQETFHVHKFAITVSNPDLARAIRLIKPKLREAILLSNFTDMTDLEVAAILGIPKSTLHDRKKAALRRLHVHLTGKEASHE